ncbi:MAG: HD domain-containing protein [Gemmatimonadales bacterium]|nr:HD domain-containing protein [Gemmatimonadales bacterium]
MNDVRQPELAHLTDHFLAVLQRVCRSIAKAGGRAWLVGGTVRDCSLGLPTRDFDLEVFGLRAIDLREALEKEYALDLVGANFGILKLKGFPIDIGLPRRETKTGRGHQGFLIDSDPELPLPEAAARRDFTINSMYLDPLNGELADPWGGLDDLRRGILRHTSSAFGEDPLRVLRGMQLVARFNLQAAPDTLALCRAIGLEGMAAERIFAEWSKLLTLGTLPSRGLTFLKDADWLKHFPELAALPGVPQNPRWHPEGDVWVHTLHSLDVFAAEKIGEDMTEEMVENRHEDLVVGFAVLCHDLGKPDTTETSADGTIRSLGHEQHGVDLTRAFLERMAVGPRLIEEITPLVAEHMRPATLFDADASDAAVRRLAVRVGRIDRLLRVARADALGRPPLSDDGFPAGEWLAEKARILKVETAPPVPLIQGRHLMVLGQEPGRHFKEILNRLYEAQLAGKFMTEEEGIERARVLLRKK